MKVISRIVKGMVPVFTTIETVISTTVSGPMIAELAEAVFTLRMDPSLAVCLLKIRLMAMWSLKIGRATCSKPRMKRPKHRFSLAPKSQVQQIVKTEAMKCLVGSFRAVSRMAVSISKFIATVIGFSLGVINYKNGDKFRGSFKDGRPCGYGTMKYMYSLKGSNGSEFEEATYEGMWKAGKRDGSGTITWADGSVFTGLWKDDMRLEGEMRN